MLLIWVRHWPVTSRRRLQHSQYKNTSSIPFFIIFFKKVFDPVCVENIVMALRMKCPYRYCVYACWPRLAVVCCMCLCIACCVCFSYMYCVFLCFSCVFCFLCSCLGVVFLCVFRFVLCGFLCVHVCVCLGVVFMCVVFLPVCAVFLYVVFMCLYLSVYVAFCVVYLCLCACALVLFSPRPPPPPSFGTCCCFAQFQALHCFRWYHTEKWPFFPSKVSTSCLLCCCWGAFVETRMTQQVCMYRKSCLTSIFVKSTLLVSYDAVNLHSKIKRFYIYLLLNVIVIVIVI